MSAAAQGICRVVIAPDSFKGSVDARTASEAIAAGWLSVRPHDEIIRMPMADGGEGTLSAIEVCVALSVRVPVTVDGPDGRRVNASWLRLPDGTGLVELAETSGLGLMRSLQALDAHTLGFGQAIADALRHGVSRLSLAVGGSASTDGGAGALMALGARLLTATAEPIALGGRGLAEVAQIDLSELTPLPAGGAVILTDVNNPLCGPRGAAAVFGPQKGASPAEVELLDRALARFAAVCGADPDVPGTGAAGGTAYGLRVWGATVASGAEFVAAQVGLPQAIADADLVITGEGSYDGQSAAGKAPAIVHELARSAGVPAALVAGRIGADTSLFSSAIALVELAGSAEAAIARPVEFLREAGRRLARGR